jgi:triose/dihydroxyacetone kinase / FAD-AMP lyase (cyclizing)
MALGTLQKATPARVGDRTLMDALISFVETLNRGSQDTLTQAVQAARKGSESTKGMLAAFGRAVYVEEGGWKEVPDPGAEAVVYLVRGLLDVD